MKIEGFPEKKNLLVSKLKTMLGEPMVYSGPPEFAYDIGDYRINRDGSLVVADDKADKEVIEALCRYKLIHEPEPITSAGDDGLLPDRQQPQTPQQQQLQQPQPVQSTQPTQLQTAGYLKRPEVVKPTDWNYSEVKEQVKEAETGPVVVWDDNLTIRAMINLVNLIYSKGDLINRSIGRANAFWVAPDLIQILAYERPDNFEDFAQMIGVQDRLCLVKGLEFTPDSIRFTGFPDGVDCILRMTYEKLAKSICDYVKKRQWINTKKLDVENEKYYFRNFLNALGFGGAENKTYRDILLRNLDGNGAYRTNLQFMAYKSRKQSEHEKQKRKAKLLETKLLNEANARMAAGEY